ncbi:MAG: hypothetical protein KC550_00525 [Nanoarchaeota archaeon]|nr:hypothetical protein [Nanoarchaeota archaeon]
MKLKLIGIILIVVSLFLGISTFIIQDSMDNLFMEQMMNFEGESCFLEDGTCIHENPLKGLFVVFYIVETSLFLFGIYLITQNNIQNYLIEKLHETSSNLKEIKEKDSSEKEFLAFLKGFSDDERKILMEVKKQDGIWQSTLRIKTGFSKATLSILLSKLESEGHISKVKKGKTNEIYLNQ